MGLIEFLTIKNKEKMDKINEDLLYLNARLKHHEKKLKEIGTDSYDVIVDINSELGGGADQKYYDSMHAILLRKINYLFSSPGNIKVRETFKNPCRVLIYDMEKNRKNSMVALRQLQQDIRLVSIMFDVILDHYYWCKDNTYQELHQQVGDLLEQLLNDCDTSWNSQHELIQKAYSDFAQNKKVQKNISKYETKKYTYIDLGFQAIFENRRGPYKAFFDTESSVKYHQNFVDLINRMRIVLYPPNTFINNLNEAEELFLKYLYLDFSKKPKKLSDQLLEKSKKTSKQLSDGRSNKTKYEKQVPYFMKYNKWEQFDIESRQILWSMITELIDEIPIGAGKEPEKDYSRLEKYIQASKNETIQDILDRIEMKLRAPHHYRISEKLAEFQNCMQINPTIEELLPETDNTDYHKELDHIEKQIDRLIEKTETLYAKAYREIPRIDTTSKNPTKDETSQYRHYQYQIRHILKLQK